MNVIIKINSILNKLLFFIKPNLPFKFKIITQKCLIQANK
jgi:hypothetical protein